MSFSSYLLRRFVRNPGEALRIKRASEELSDYVAWKLYTQLQESGLLRVFEEKPWWGFRDRDLARLVQDILVEDGLAKRLGDTIRAVKAPRRPEITTKEAADMLAVLDKALQILPEVIESGEKPEYSKVKALTAKLVGSFGVRLEFEAAVEVSGLDKLPEGAVVLDVFPRVGTSTTTPARANQGEHPGS
uniref:Uncharacterized protein n=1 Tax=Thermofilum pendens TaxID=2269 RepID=A0A7C3SKK0_THEPE